MFSCWITDDALAGQRHLLLGERVEVLELGHARQAHAGEAVGAAGQRQRTDSAAREAPSPRRCSCPSLPLMLALPLRLLAAPTFGLVCRLGRRLAPACGGARWRRRLASSASVSMASMTRARSPMPGGVPRSPSSRWNCVRASSMLAGLLRRQPKQLPGAETPRVAVRRKSVEPILHVRPAGAVQSQHGRLQLRVVGEQGIDAALLGDRLVGGGRLRGLAGLALGGGQPQARQHARSRRAAAWRCPPAPSAPRPSCPARPRAPRPQRAPAASAAAARRCS